MATKNNNNNDGSSQAPGGDNGTGSSPNGNNANQVLKSGSLFLSSKGIGWFSWKKRWFILSRTSLVFFRCDPSAAPQKGAEMNLTLGGIDLNSSASVEVKPDKKLITMFFPDGREGRAFTLKAESLDDLYEWKTALESAIAQAPSPTHSMEQNGAFTNEQTAVANGPGDQQKDKSTVTANMVIGRPILLALEDIDGTPSFLEKALSFVENHGVKVEGILRQAADVEEVHRRVREYEQGKIEFSPNEDGHIIGDCIKYILRELPSSPVPASCCTALLQAYKSDRPHRANNMRIAILETFPEPNRRLLQRILVMCKKVAAHKEENLMSISAVAACMSPLLLRPLLSGECELENTHMDVAGDGSLQLLQAAAAANHAQAIIITLLEEYNHIFGENTGAHELFSNSEESGSETEEVSDEEYDDEEEEYDEEDEEEYEDEDEDEYEDEDEEEYDHDHESGSDDIGTETDGEYEHSVAVTNSDDEVTDDDQSERSPERKDHHLAKPHDDPVQSTRNTMKHEKELSLPEVDVSSKEKSSSKVNNPKLGRSPANRNHPPVEPDDFSPNEGDEIERLVAAKLELQNRVAEEADANAKMKANIERRKKALQERRLALEKDVARLREQLQKEKDIRAALEAEMNMVQPPDSKSSNDKKVNIKEIVVAKENFNNLEHRLDDLGAELTHQIQQNTTLMQDRGINMEITTREVSTYIERSSESEHQNRTSEPLKGSSSKTGLLSADSSLEVPGAKNSSSPSKKSNKGEGNNPTSALTKLTTRLNLLKERRNQIASELQNIDKTEGPSGPVVKNPITTTPNVEKSRDPEGNHDHHHTHQPSNNQRNANKS